jgi:hypothetical protein
MHVPTDADMDASAGWMPWMIIAPILSAITGLDGMPDVSIGMNEGRAPALFADSRCGRAFDRSRSHAARRGHGMIVADQHGRQAETDEDCPGPEVLQCFQ